MSGIYKWGPQTWIFFHTFANRINKDFFERNRAQCLEIIKMIAECLPCPECTKHATYFMKTVNEHTVRTKEKLIEMLFIFHNSVNKRVGKKSADQSVLERYNNERIDIAYINFINGYAARYGNIMSGAISTLGKRKKITRNVQKWMEKYWRYFQ